MTPTRSWRSSIRQAIKLPRPLVQSGISGPGQELFPESAKQQARDIGLVKELVQVLRNEKEDDGGGDTIDNWKPHGKRVDGRIDALSRRGMGQVIGEQVNEATTHVATLEPGVDVTTNDRLEIEGQVWIITSQEIHTDQATVRVQVKEIRS